MSVLKINQLIKNNNNWSAQNNFDLRFGERPAAVVPAGAMRGGTLADLPRALIARIRWLPPKLVERPLGEGSMARFQRLRLTQATCCAAVALAAVGLAGRPAYAIDFDIDGWTGSADTALLTSGTIRTESPDLKLYGTFYHGTGTGVPSDGDLNFKQGDLVSQPNRISEEVQLKKDETTIFVRGTAFYDTVLATGSNADFRPFDHGSINASGHAAHLLDAFVDQKFDLGGNPSSIRIGNQVINWGESTFIQNGINSASPVDATAAHVPGTELKEIILPVTAIDFKTSLGDFNFEGYYQLLNAHDRLDGEGSFFAINNVSPGMEYIVEPGNGTHNPSQQFLNFTSLFANQFGAASQFGYEDQVDPSKSAKNLSNEFGFSVRTSVPEWQDAEFGAYFENYASRLPFFQYRTGSAAAVVPDGLGLIGLGPSTAYFATSGISLTYPSNIHLIGGSFNFNGPFELAFQGEVSTRLNQPLELSISDALFGVDTPALCDPNFPLAGIAAFKTACLGGLSDPVVQDMGIHAGSFDGLYQGYKRFPVTQFQYSVTKLWSNIPDTPIQTVTLVGEAALDYVGNFPKSSALLESPGTTNFSGFSFNGVPNVPTTGGTIQSTQLASQTSYGYVLNATADFPHTMPAGIDMVPRLTFQHDVQGTSPIGAGNFVAHTAQLAVGVDFSYLQNLTWGLTYVKNLQLGGSPETNTNIDLDFVSAYLGYQF
jgi:hypothetical protein